MELDFDDYAVWASEVCVDAVVRVLGVGSAPVVLRCLGEFVASVTQVTHRRCDIIVVGRFVYDHRVPDRIAYLVGHLGNRS